jgi:hypothetical protein
LAGVWPFWASSGYFQHPQENEPYFLVVLSRPHQKCPFSGLQSTPAYS